MKPTHKPPRSTDFQYDPETKLLALNVLIQKEKRLSVPHKLLIWAESYYRKCVQYEAEISPSLTRKKAA